MAARCRAVDFAGSEPFAIRLLAIGDELRALLLAVAELRGECGKALLLGVGCGFELCAGLRRGAIAGDVSLAPGLNCEHGGVRVHFVGFVGRDLRVRACLFLGEVRDERREEVAHVGFVAFAFKATDLAAEFRLARLVALSLCHDLSISRDLLLCLDRLLTRQARVTEVHGRLAIVVLIRIANHVRDLDATLIAGFAGEIARIRFVIRQRDDGIPHLLGGHASQHGRLEMIRLPAHEFIGTDNRLISPRVRDDREEGAHIIVQRDHELLQKGLDLGQHGLGVIAQLIQWLDQRDTEHLLPKPIHNHPIEGNIVWRCHPTREDLGAVFFGTWLRRLAKDRPWHHDIAGLAVFLFEIERQLQHGVMLAIHRDGTEKLADPVAYDVQHGPELHGIHALLLALLCDLAAVTGGSLLPFEVIENDLLARFERITHATERLMHGLVAIGEGGEAVELGLLPFVERMIVALRALDARAEEDARRDRHVVERHVGIAPVVADRAILPAVSFGRKHLAHELVIRLVRAEALFDPLGIRGGHDAGGVHEMRLQAQDVGPEVVEV